MAEAKAGRPGEGAKAPELSPDVVYHINERAKHTQSYSDRLRKIVDRVSGYFKQIREQSGIVFVSDHVVSLNTERSDPTLAPNLLAVTGYGLSLLYPLPHAKGLVVEYGGIDFKYGKKRTSSFSREELMETVRVLPQFFQDYAEELENNEVKIKGFAEKAEKIASICSE